MTTENATPTEAASTAQRSSAYPGTLAILGGAGHLAAMDFHQRLHQRLLATGFITTDTDLPDIVHVGYGLGGADGHFDPAHTARWLDSNARVLSAVNPDLVVAVCNTVQPSLHAHPTAARWPVMDNLAVIGSAVTTMFERPDSAPATPAVWLASHGAYTQGLFPHPGDALADLAEDMIAHGMNGRTQASHTDVLVELLDEHPDAPVVLACTDLSAYAEDLRNVGITVIDAVEELLDATLAALPTLGTTTLTPAPPAATAFKEATR